MSRPALTRLGFDPDCLFIVFLLVYLSPPGTGNLELADWKLILWGGRDGVGEGVCDSLDRGSQPRTSGWGFKRLT